MLQYHDKTVASGALVHTTHYKEENTQTMFTFSRFLLYFTETARQGSFHKASEALRVSASSIDHQTLRVE